MTATAVTTQAAGLQPAQAQADTSLKLPAVFCLLPATFGYDFFTLDSLRDMK
jgi:hypothetical protein